MLRQRKSSTVLIRDNYELKLRLQQNRSFFIIPFMKNTPKYALAIFDMDGTILNTIDDLADSLNVILERYSMPLHTVDQVRFMVGNGIPKLIERAIPNGRDNPKFDEILKEYIAYYEEHSAIKTRPYDGIVEAVKALRKSGVKIAVNTNKVEAAARFGC